MGNKVRLASTAHVAIEFSPGANAYVTTYTPCSASDCGARGVAMRQVVARGGTDDVTSAGGDPLDMRLTVHAGASMPLPPTPSRLSEVKVPALALHAGGKLSLQPGGLAHRLSTQLHAAGLQLGLREDARVMMSPTSAAYAHVVDGVMHCDRAEMLLGGDSAVMKVRARWV